MGDAVDGSEAEGVSVAVFELEREEVLVAEGMSTSAALTNRDAAMSTGLTPVALV